MSEKKEKIKIPEEVILAKAKPFVEKFTAGITTGERYRNFSKKAAEKLVKWHYDLAGLPMPEVVIAENMEEMFKFAKKTKGAVDFTKQMETKTKPAMQRKIEVEIFEQVDIQEAKNFYLGIQKPINDMLAVNLYDVLKNTLSDLTKDTPNIISTIGWNGVSIVTWKSFTSEPAGLGLGTKIEDFEEWRDMYVDARIFASILSSKTAIICKYPMEIHYGEDGRLHNAAGPAVLWGHTKGEPEFDCYYLHGRRMDRELFDMFKQGRLTKEAFLGEQDEDRRAGMYEIIESQGEGSMMTFLGAEVVDKQNVVHENGEMEELTLYKTKEKFALESDLTGKSNVPLAWLGVVCPSTGQRYMLPSDSSFTNVIDAAKYHRPEEVPTDKDYRFKFRS